MDWFLYDNGLRHERVKNNYLIKLKSLVPSNSVSCESVEAEIFPKVNKHMKDTAIRYSRACDIFPWTLSSGKKL